MIRCKIELLPYGKEEDSKLIGLILIVNDGTGTFTKGNYKSIIKTEDPFKIEMNDLKDILYEDKEIPGLLSGKVKKFPRVSIVYNLLAKCLNACGFK